MNRVTISFGNSTLTVPTAGIPISKGKCGCPNIIESMIVVDQGSSGYQFQYDQSAEVLFIMQAPAQTHSHHLAFKNAVANTGSGALAAENVVTVAANKIGANTGSDINVLSGGLSGGVSAMTQAAQALGAASAVAIAAQVIEVEVIGW
jgi:hypothetical protein